MMLLIVIQAEQMRQYEVTIDSSTKSAVRTAVGCARCCEEKEIWLKGDNAAPSGALIFLVLGEKGTTVGGHGDILKTFEETGKVTGYPGEGTALSNMFDENYENAPLKLMRYDQTFKKHKKDVSQSK